jgi:hypothetical protein
MARTAFTQASKGEAKALLRLAAPLLEKISKGNGDSSDAVDEVWLNGLPKGTGRSCAQQMCRGGLTGRLEADGICAHFSKQGLVR